MLCAPSTGREGLCVRLTIVVGLCHAENVRKYLGQFADEGGYFEVRVVAADLEELEPLGKLKRAPAIEWNDSGATPKTRTRYELPSEQ